MNITLRCQGSKREQAKLPICAARRRTPRRAGCRGDPTKCCVECTRSLIVRTVVDPADLFLPSFQAGAAPPRRAAGAFASVLGASWASTTSPSNAPSSLSRVDAVKQKPCAQRPPPVPMIRSALFNVLSDIGTRSSLDVQRRRIGAFGFNLASSATESTPEVVLHEVSVSLGIWGTMDGGTQQALP